MSRAPAILSALVGLLFGACAYISLGQIPCEDDSECPVGSQCGPSGHCELTPTSNAVSGDAGAGTPCEAKDQCPIGLACVNDVCGPSPATCTADSSCARGEICTFSETCTAGCDADEDCLSPQTCNMSTYFCTGCSASSPCPSGQLCIMGACESGNACTSSTPCNEATAGTVCLNGACGQCTQTSDCSSAPYGAGYVCASTGLCVLNGCSANSDCASNPLGDTFCDTSTGTCVGCVSSNNCPSGQTCQNNQCLPSGSTGCTSNSDCSATPATPVCEISMGVCVQCQTSSDCSATTPVCDVQLSQCVQCLSASDCAAGQTCDLTSDTCQGVSCDAATCGSMCSANGQMCDTTTCTCTGTATGCTSNANCSAHSQTPVCDTIPNDPDLGKCVQCVQDSDCPAGEACTSYTCAASTTSTCSGQSLNLGGSCGYVCQYLGGTCNATGVCCI